MIAVDTNILVYSHRRDSEFFHRASECIRDLAESATAWAIPWPCVHEFIGVVTNPRALKNPSSLEEAIDQVNRWRESPSLSLLSETADHWKVLSAIAIEGRIIGPRIHDARIAAICKAHGVRELWTADRDFTRISGLKTRNPLLKN